MNKHYGHNIDVTEQPWYCTDCEEPVYSEN